MTKIPCPYTYSNGKRCNGHVVRVEAYKADLEWTLQDDGSWAFAARPPRSHYHVFCSEKENHAGFGRPDAGEMKFYFNDLPTELRSAIA